MVVITQLIYLHPGKEIVFDEFEAMAIPLIGKHGGELLLRLRPTQDGVIAGSIDVPYEIHLVRFPSDVALASFTADPERRRASSSEERLGAVVARRSRIGKLTSPFPSRSVLQLDSLRSPSACPARDEDPHDAP